MSMGCSLLTDALADATKRSYSRVWHLLHNFCVEINRPEQSQPPVSPSIVFLFLTKQVGRGVAGRSLLTYCSAISFVHKKLILSEWYDLVSTNMGIRFPFIDNFTMYKYVIIQNLHGRHNKIKEVCN